VEGADTCDLTWSADEFGNRICHVLAKRVERRLTFEARYRVQRGTGAAPTSMADAHRYLQSTRLTRSDWRLEAVAADIAARAATPLERAERAHTWAAGALLYQVGVTGVHTAATAALDVGRGVCQDFAHILLSVLRILRIPARYVSGHLLGEGVAHAWVEALVADDAGSHVIAYDPTHNRRVRPEYVTVAVGRDFADVTPTSGVYTGAATGILTASKAAALVPEPQDEAAVA
jgi:transglutaminase-like putative cysteine protease